MPTDTTTAIFGSWVLLQRDSRSELLRDRWVLVEGRTIAAVVPDRPSADIVLDTPGRLVLPGLLNLHNHCFSESIARTHTEDGCNGLSLAEMIFDVLLPLSLKGADLLSAEERRAVARLGVLQLLKAGATTVMEPFRHTIPEMFDAAEEMGLRFYGAPYVFSSQGESDGDMCDLSIWNELYDRWHGAGGDRIRVAMSPHATDTCSPDLLQSACARAAELDIPLTIHVAQSRDEVDTIRRRHGGRSPVEYLDWLGLLRPNMLAAHCVECSDNDLSLLAARDVTILNCPRTLARAGVTASYARFAAHGVRTLVATDGYNMDIVSELGAAALISKTSSGRADVASASELVDAVTRQAAKAIGRDDLGVIRKGASADLTVLDLSGPYLNPLHDPLRAMVTLGNRADVETVMVDGRLLVREGRFQLGDEGNIVSAGAAAVAKIWNLPEARRAFDREGPAA